MNNLPGPSGSDSPQGINPPGLSGTNDTPVDSGIQFSPGAGLGAKELEPAPALNFSEQIGAVENQKDIELPKEVVKAGVTVQPVQIPIPPTLTSAGVQPAGNNVPFSSGQTVVLPLTDGQIAQGLKLSVAESWRWLAEWCLRRLSQMRLAGKSDHNLNSTR